MSSTSGTPALSVTTNRAGAANAYGLGQGVAATASSTSFDNDAIRIVGQGGTLLNLAVGATSKLSVRRARLVAPCVVARQSFCSSCTFVVPSRLLSSGRGAIDCPVVLCGDVCCVVLSCVVLWCAVLRRCLRRAPPLLRQLRLRAASK